MTEKEAVTVAVSKNTQNESSRCAHPTINV